MHRTVIFLFFCMIFVDKTCTAQYINEVFLSRPPRLQTLPKFNITSKPLPGKAFIAMHKSVSVKLLPVRVYFPSVYPGISCVIPADFYTRGFGFFCKNELNFEKKSKISLKVRLGSLAYVDHLEGKPNSRILPGQ